MMLYQITEIEFDFESDDEELDAFNRGIIIDEVTNTIWEADDEDDLIEEVTCATGWCIKSIDYLHVLV